MHVVINIIYQISLFIRISNRSPRLVQDTSQLIVIQIMLIQK